jgi:F420H(2)-dependent quinone reductase
VVPDRSWKGTAVPLEGTYVPGTWEMAADQVARFEASDGVDGGELNGAPCIILTTKGARTGAIRKSPLVRVTDGHRYAALGSMGGAPTSPNWVHNLRSHPLCELQDGAVRKDYLAREVTGDERTEWWARATEAWPPYDEYQARTERVIPVFVLDPVE